jgi:hypothetical protein
MVSAQEAFDFMQIYRSRYDYMIESTHPEDKANAEACRLACRVWQEIAFALKTGGDIEFELDTTIAKYKPLWDKYLETGIPVIQQYELREFDENGKPVEDPRLADIITYGIVALDTKAQEIADHKKKLRDEKEASLSKAEKAARRKAAEKGVSLDVDHEILGNVSPRAFDDIIWEIKQRCGFTEEDERANEKPLPSNLMGVPQKP